MSVLKKEPAVCAKPFSDVYISTGNGLIKTVIKKGFDALGGIEKFVKPGQSVLIKPNLTAGEDPMTGGTTEPRFCEAIIELIKEHCRPGPIYCAENTGTGTETITAYRRFGFVELCERQGVEMVDFTNTERVDVEIPGAMYADVISMPKLIMDVDVFITLPILKTHSSVGGMTAAIKNSFGLVEDHTRRTSHRDNAVEQYLVDITRARAPDFAIVDGRIGMEGIAGGSRFDHPRFANRIIMGADPVAVDVVCTHIMMQNPRIRHLQWAADFGLGNDNLDYINIHGMPLEEAKLPFMSPAGEIEEQTCGRMRLTDLGSCSLCRVVVQSSLFRFSSPDSLIKDVEIVYGPGEWDTSGGKSQCSLLVGDCIREEYRSMGAWVPGCPVSREGFIEALAAQDIVCSKCEQAVNTFIENHKPEELEFVRILASNKTVYQSAANMAGPTDFLLAVGNCQLPYARFHVTRSKDELIQMGIADKVSADFFVIHIPGHNPSQDELEAALSELKKRAEKWEALQKD